MGTFKSRLTVRGNYFSVLALSTNGSAKEKKNNVFIQIGQMRKKLKLKKFSNFLLFVSVTKLREHWDETNSKVMQRKTQLDAMLGDSQRYEAKRQEVDAWLARMETRLERMVPVGHTADVLEAQLREQKVRSF